MDATDVGVFAADANEAINRRAYRVGSGEVIVEGQVLVFGTDIHMEEMIIRVNYGYIRDTFPQWYRIKPPIGGTIRLLFGRPGLVVPIDGRVISGAAEVSAPLARLAISAHMFCVAEMALTSPTAEQLDTQIYPRVEPVIGLAGDSLGFATKAPTVQGAQGFTSLVALVTPSPVYITLSFARPACGQCEDQPLTPAYICLRSDDWDFPSPGPGGGIKLGDLSNLANPNKPFNCVIACLDSVSDIGYWFADTEEACILAPTATDEYTQITVGVYTLLNGRETPLSGGAFELCPGLVRASLPGLAAGLGVQGGGYGNL